ncbi:MAG: ribosome maturation factor RimM [Hyphomicrobiaceae bacterium]|nr:ribosome maturation factor RimM [Hyphomicrobiaceae bacterium]
MTESEAGAGRRILLGRIAGAHGIRGEVLIKTFTGRPEDIAAYGPLEDGCGRRLLIEALRATPRGVVARLAGIADRTAAEALKGRSLYVARASLPVAAEGEFYYADLIGLAAVDPDGRALGEVVDVHNHGAGDLLELRLADDGKTELVPFTDAFVPEVDLAASRVVVRLPETDETDEGSSPSGSS